MGFLTFITSCLTVLKIAGLTTISWWLVVTPILAGLGATFIVSFVIAFAAALMSSYKRR